MNRTVSLEEKIGLSVVLAAALWMYAGAFRSSFIQDDFGWLVLSRFHSVGEWARCFFRFNEAGTYRPLSQETYFWLCQKLFGMWAAGFHIFSLAAHLAAVYLVYRLSRLFSPPAGAIAGAFFYAVHSAHVTSLYWISAFPEPLAIVFLLASVIAFIHFDRTSSRAAYALSLASMVAGIFSKESILSLPLMLAAYCFLRSPSKLIWTLPHFGLSAGCVLLRLSSRVRLAPYELSLGANTFDTLAAYLSWMSGFSGTVASWLGWPLPLSYRWIAALFAAATILLLAFSRSRRTSVWALIWIAAALQPVLYFAGHSYPYYLAPALAGFSLLLGTVFPPSPGLPARKTVVTAAALFLALSLQTVKPEGDWWAGRTMERRNFIDRLIAIDRSTPDSGTAYVFGFTEKEFGHLENGGVFKACNLPVRKFRILMPELDPQMPDLLRSLKRGGLDQAYCFVFSASGVADQTKEFRMNPDRFLASRTVEIRNVPQLALEASPAEVRRGRDRLSLRLVNLEADAVDVLYSIDGQLMPPVLQWRLDDRRGASVFADLSTPPGAYEFVAIRPSGSSAWLKVSARVVVR